MASNSEITTIARKSDELIPTTPSQKIAMDATNKDSKELGTGYDHSDMMRMGKTQEFKVS
jgi:hypothetical protein